MCRRVFLKKILPVFLLLVWGALFNSICVAGPLMVEKNLFATDRKPPPPESADSAQKPAKPGMAIGNLQLDGIVIESNAKRAILRMKNQQGGAPAKKGQPASPFVTVHEGETISDYRVSKIDFKSISLERDGQTFTVGLFAENKVATPPSPAAPAPQPQPAQGVAQQEGQPPPVQVQPGLVPQQQVSQGQAPPPNSGVASFPGRGRNLPPNINAPIPEPVINQDPNQPAETVEEEE